MNDLYFCDPTFDSQGYIDKPILEEYMPDCSDIALFDQNGYDLTELEKKFYLNCTLGINEHRNDYHTSLRKPWFLQYPMNLDMALHLIKQKEDPFSPKNNVLFKKQGAILNHAFILERKGYSGKAREQLLNWSESCPKVWKVINIRPKWGIDFSIDYVGEHGETFEIFHYEWDSFYYEEIIQTKETLEKVIMNTDWEKKALELLENKDDWCCLDFFKQSDYKCNFFGLPPERFKMVTWE